MVTSNKLKRKRNDVAAELVKNFKKVCKFNKIYEKMSSDLLK